MLNTKSVKHNYISYLWVPDDVVEVAEQKCLAAKLPLTKTKPLSLCLRLLEVKKDARLKELDERGVSEEELTEEMLWFDIEWPRLSRFALRFCGASSLQKIFPVVMQAGFARQRYIKRHPKSGERICREDGAPLVYATYQEAQLDEEHPGTIIHQALFESEALNEAIAALDRPPSPSGGGTAPSPVREGQKNEGAQRGQTGSLCSTERPSNTRDASAARVGNPDTTDISQRNIPSPSQKYQGADSPSDQRYHTGTPPQPIREGGEAPSAELSRPSAKTGTPANQEGSPGCEDPLRQSANSKDSKSKNLSKETEEIGSITGGGAATDTLSHFDFFREWGPAALEDLFALTMPLPDYKFPDKRAKAEQETTSTCQKLANFAFLRERGLVYAARVMCYIDDPTSPCTWREEINKKRPELRDLHWVRPWHFSEKMVRRAGLEMERADWWPPAFPRTASTSHEALAGGTAIIDLAELAGITPDQRQGMDRVETCRFVADLRAELDFPGVHIDFGSVNRWQKNRGYFIEFWYADGQMLKFYSRTDWKKIEAHAALLGTPDFLLRLTEACAASQVA